VPAEAARAPAGATYTSTGSLHASMLAMICRIDSARPPGVSSRSTIATAPSATARCEASSKYSAAAGPIGPSSAICATMPAPGARPGATPVANTSDIGSARTSPSQASRSQCIRRLRNTVTMRHCSAAHVQKPISRPCSMPIGRGSTRAPPFPAGWKRAPAPRTRPSAISRHCPPRLAQAAEPGRSTQSGSRAASP